ncbi:MAG: hypothetical protein ACJAYB_000014 [Psychromonas sp.]|jgi:hypothetical protein
MALSYLNKQDIPDDEGDNYSEVKSDAGVSYVHNEMIAMQAQLNEGNLGLTAANAATEIANQASKESQLKLANFIKNQEADKLALETATAEAAKQALTDELGNYLSKGKHDEAMAVSKKLSDQAQSNADAAMLLEKARFTALELTNKELIDQAEKVKLESYSLQLSSAVQTIAAGYSNAASSKGVAEMLKATGRVENINGVLHYTDHSGRELPDQNALIASFETDDLFKPFKNHQAKGGVGAQGGGSESGTNRQKMSDDKFKLMNSSEQHKYMTSGGIVTQH